MPQEVHNDHDSIRAKNITVKLNRGSSIVLNGVLVIGSNNFGLTLTNYASSSSALNNVNILGSEDNMFYYFIQQNVFPVGVSPGETSHFEFTTTSHFLQVVVGTDIDATFDVYVTGIP